MRNIVVQIKNLLINENLAAIALQADRANTQVISNLFRLFSK